MSVATEITRLQGLKETLRTKLVAMLGIAATADLEDCVTAVGGIEDRGGVTQTVSVATPSYTIPAGYHDGTGAVGVTVETKSATPTTTAQDITPTSGKVLSKVTVNAIPSNYADVSQVDAAVGNVLSGKKFVDATRALKTGTMVNNGAVNQTINGTTVGSYTVPAGYHNGSGTVSLDGTIEAALAAI